jgi:nitrite reductase/ring-hydroxylating ferredoxin subunit
MLDHWIKLCAAADCPPGRAKFVSIDGYELAVFHLENPDRVVVTHNSCPHAGGNLAAGQIAGGVVTCPWHEWQFNLDSGACILSPTVKLHRYECKVENGAVFARLPQSEPRPKESAAR